MKYNEKNLISEKEKVKGSVTLAHEFIESDKLSNSKLNREWKENKTVFGEKYSKKELELFNIRDEILAPVQNPEDIIKVNEKMFSIDGTDTESAIIFLSTTGKEQLQKYFSKGFDENILMVVKETNFINKIKDHNGGAIIANDINYADFQSLLLIHIPKLGKNADKAKDRVKGYLVIGKKEGNFDYFDLRAAWLIAMRAGQYAHFSKIKASAEAENARYERYK